MLALAFLVLIGMALVADGFEVHIPRGYIYFAMAFAASVEGFNIIAGRNRAQAGAAQTEGLMAQQPVLLITGAGRGIGAATAKLAAARGFDVGVNYKTDAASAASVVEAVKAQGRKAVAIAGQHGGRSRRRAHVQDRRRQARAADAFRLQHRHPGPRRPARRRRAPR